MDGRAPPPPPPPHSSAPPPRPGAQPGSLPHGNYDIFIIPPHASGGGFLYLPSMQCHRNSFLAGVACTLTVVGIWSLVAPWIRFVTSTLVTSSGLAIIMVMVGMAGMAFYIGSKQNEPPFRGHDPGASSSSSSSQQQQQQQQQHGYAYTPPPKPSWQRTTPTPGGTSGWEKAREEMKKKDEERRRREELEKRAKERADKEKWDQAAARAKELREKMARDEEARKKTQHEREDRERRDRDARTKASASAAGPSHAPKAYHKPTASSYMGDDDGYSFRPYDTPNPKRAQKVNSQGSLFSESSGAPSHSTAHTTPPPSHRGPYSNKDPDKVTIKAVYAFTDLFAKPVAQLVSGQGSVTNGLVLKMTTEGLFIDDDVRGVPQREWDVRAWTMKLVENGDFQGLHILRASVRDAENKKYIFVIDEAEAWKVAVGLQRLRKGSQVRSLGVSSIGLNETRTILAGLGW